MNAPNHVQHPLEGMTPESETARRVRMRFADGTLSTRRSRIGRSRSRPCTTRNRRRHCRHPSSTARWGPARTREDSNVKTKRTDQRRPPALAGNRGRGGDNHARLQPTADAPATQYAVVCRKSGGRSITFGAYDTAAMAEQVAARLREVGAVVEVVSDEEVPHA